MPAGWPCIFVYGVLLLLLSLSLLPAAPPAAASASDWPPSVSVPLEEYTGYFDANGVYTVIGNIKNNNAFAIVPTVTVHLTDGGPAVAAANDDDRDTAPPAAEAAGAQTASVSKTVRHVLLGPQTELPFKIKFPGLEMDAPVPADPEVSFEAVPVPVRDVPISVLYDETLVQHDDGHITGRIQNTGDRTVYHPKIYAVVHGHDSVLDVAQNIDWIEKIDPGQIIGFSMYPDPSIAADQVSYYSCFAPVDTTVVPVTALKNGGDFDFRYDSGAWYYGAAFDEQGTTMTINGYNSYPIKTYANFEFVPISGNETFHVTADGQPVRFTQSIDEMGLWHVAFDVEPTFQGVISISGFEEGLPPAVAGSVPAWIKQGADWWSDGLISDSEFMEGLAFLMEKGLLEPPSLPVAGGQQYAATDADADATADTGNYDDARPPQQSAQGIPQWMKATSGWWYDGRISDEQFLRAVQWLIWHDLLRV